MSKEPMNWCWLLCAGAGIILWLASSAMAQEPLSSAPNKDDLLHVASPIWQDQILYFMLTDRFADGDPTNNDQHAGEYDPHNAKKYSGGDLQGVSDKLDYLAELGVTAVWITPPVANMWWDPTVGASGYLGSWAENFRQLDKHLGSIETLQNLARGLHRRGMYLLQDIVCNNVGNFFYYNGPYDAKHPWRHFKRNEKALPHNAPTQKPFDQNDATKTADRKAAIYHFTPDIADLNDGRQLLNYQLEGLDDLNTMNPRVRQELKDSYAYWIKEGGVDGFHLTSAVHTTKDFWFDFLRSSDPLHPGVKEAAKQVGHKDFFAFGEVGQSTAPYDDNPDKLAASYLGDAAHPAMDGVVNLPLHTALIQVFVEGEPTALLSHRLNNAMTLYRDPLRLVNFLDNGAMARIAARTDLSAQAGALTFLMTMPGIPAIYYGTEQGFTAPRAAMFAGGFAAGGKNHFSVKSPAFLLLKNLITLRKTHPALSRGDLTLLADDKTGRGLFAFKRTYQGQSIFAFFNTARHPVLIAKLTTGLPAHTRLRLIAGTEKPVSAELLTDQDGMITEKIAPQSAVVFMSTPADAKHPPSQPVESSAEHPAADKATDSGATPWIAISSHGENDHFKQNFTLQGESHHTKNVFVAMDGDISRPLSGAMDGLGTWKVEIPVMAMTEGVHQLAAYTLDGARYVAAKPTYIFVENDWQHASESSDGIGDDRGPKGTYNYPTEPSFTHQCDIAKLTAWRAGTNLKLRITMGAPLSSQWQPKLGFDHVCFSLFFDIPALRDGQGKHLPPMRVMPFHNAQLPPNMLWNRMAFISGWNAALYSPQGAGATSYGKAIYPAPALTVDRSHNAIELIFPAQALGDPATLAGTKIYVATWDYDGMEGHLRPLAVPPSAFGFSGGGPKDPLIMDDAMITISE